MIVPCSLKLLGVAELVDQRPILGSITGRGVARTLIEDNDKKERQS